MHPRDQRLRQRFIAESDELGLKAVPAWAGIGKAIRAQRGELSWLDSSREHRRLARGVAELNLGASL
jgi:hypothetical protein